MPKSANQKIKILYLMKILLEHTNLLFFTWLMNFGADITVLSPAEVKAGLIKLAKEALSQYE